MESNANHGRSTIVVTLLPDERDTKNARLVFSGAPDGLEINFASQDQSNLRLLFQWLLDKELERESVLKLEIDSRVQNRTYRSIAESYIEDLNKELLAILQDNCEIVEQLMEAGEGA